MANNTNKPLTGGDSVVTLWPVVSCHQNEIFRVHITWDYHLISFYTTAFHFFENS